MTYAHSLVLFVFRLMFANGMKCNRAQMANFKSNFILYWFMEKPAL